MFKTLLSQVKEYKWVSLMTPIFMVLEVVCETVIPLLMASIIDYGVNVGDMNHIYITALKMMGIALLGLLCGIMGGKLAAKASTGFARNLRDAMYTNIQNFSFSNIDKFSTASLVTRLTTDVGNVQMAYQMMLRMFFRAPSGLIVAMIMAYRISHDLASIYLYAALILAVLMIVIMGSAAKHFQKVFRKYDNLNESVQENVSSIRVVKAYNREEYEKSRFFTATNNIYQLFCAAERRTALIMPVMSLTIYGCILAISWMGAQMVVGGALSTGNLMSLLTYCMQILTSLMMMGMVFVMITMSYASMKRIVEIIDEKSDLVNPENPLMEVRDGSLSFENVSFHYGQAAENDVLQNIDFTIPSGSTVGILGATGSGKTTLVSLISRLYDVSKGSVKVAGHDVREYDLKTLRNAVAFVLQKNELFSGSIYDNLRWGDEHATDEQCQKAAAIAQADGFIQTFPDGYNTHIEQGGNNVSGGQKQRLCIARALLKNPQILILDDSTSAVDTTTDAKMRKAFREDIPTMTKIIIAQRISSLQDADQIIVLEDGKISGIGTHEYLLEHNPIYASVYASQTGGNADFDEGGE